MGTASSAKAKGRLGQQEIRDRLLKAFPELHPDDVRSQIMGVNGEDIVLSPRAREVLPVSIEVKRRKSFKTLYDFVEQAVQDGKYEPIVFLRGDRQEWLAVCKADYFMELLKCRK
jgi:hypothetical protein